MSEQTQMSDIDDVMDSIRRLVSEDGGVQNTENRLVDDHKLVLTSQQRISEPEDPYRPITPMNLSPTLESELSELINDLTDEPVLPEEDSDLLGANHAFDSMDMMEAPSAIDVPLDEVPMEAAIATVTKFRRRDRKSAPLVQRSEHMKIPDELTTTPAAASEDLDLDADLSSALDVEPTCEIAPAKEEQQLEETLVDAAIEKPSIEETLVTALNEVTTQETIADTETAVLSSLNGLDVNEDELRDIIADVVQQELAGALGERITRNVRKLVRRELKTLMASEEFD